MSNKDAFYVLFFFSLFVNQIAVGKEAVGKHCIQIQPDLAELFLLFLWMILHFVKYCNRATNQLNHLNSVCKEHSLLINGEKSKVMVFRSERWFLEGNEKKVNSYTYLGYTFTTKFSLCQGVSPLTVKGKKAT